MPVFITKFLARCYNLLPQLFKKKIVYLLQHIYKKNGFLFKISVPKHFFQNLSTIKFYGMEFKVPAQTEKYLAYKYGKDWRIPKKDYVYYKEDGALKRN